jgi:WhiB family redox-sensing transcriptional regulator
MDPALFFPERGDNVAGGNATVWAAVAVCTACPVRLECAACGAHERHGIWGGTTERERRRLRRMLARGVPLADALAAIDARRRRLWPNALRAAARDAG